VTEIPIPDVGLIVNPTFLFDTLIIHGAIESKKIPRPLIYLENLNGRGLLKAD